MLTIPEFCTKCRISERQFFRLRAAGLGPTVTKLGGKILIAEFDRLQWLYGLRCKE